MAGGQPKASAEHELVARISNMLPKFGDVFDEETFYIFAFLFTLGTIALAIVTARYVNVKDAGHVDWGPGWVVAAGGGQQQNGQTVSCDVYLTSLDLQYK